MAQDNRDEFDAKKARLENPSGWIRLTRYETIRLLIDALLEAPPNYQFNKSELERRTGVSREAIREHLPFLVELGIVEEVDNGEWPEYQLNDRGKVTQELFELNSAVNSVLAGEPKNVQKEQIMSLEDVDQDSDGDRMGGSPGTELVSNSNPGDVDDELISQPPTGSQSINAD